MKSDLFAERAANWQGGLFETASAPALEARRGAKPFIYYAYLINMSLNTMKYIGFLSQRGGTSLLSRYENLPIFFVSGQRLLSEYSTALNLS